MWILNIEGYVINLYFFGLIFFIVGLFIYEIFIIFQMCEKAEEAICEQTMADMLYLTENEGKLRLDNFNIWWFE